MREAKAAAAVILLILVLGFAHPASAQQPTAKSAAKTGYAVKKPVFGGACPSCPWGAIADIVKAALQPYGWDVQICYSCAGGARAARLVAAKFVPPRPEPGSNQAPPPDGPVDFGGTGAQFLWWAYQGTHDFAKDPEGPRKQLRIVANIQDPQYMLVAVKAGSGITDLRDILQKKLPVRIASTTIGGQVTAAINEYYGWTKESLAANKGEFLTNAPLDQRDQIDVFIGFGTLDNAPEYSLWYDISQRLDLKFLELPKDLREKLVKEFDLEEQTIPEGLLRGVDRRIPAVARTGTVIYGRTDMPDDFAYTLAKAMDEQQHLLQWSLMNFSYNQHAVWKAYGIPLHPGAAKYYKERGYMK